MNTPEQIERMWVQRAVEQGYKPGTMKYARAELEFFCGAMAALDKAFPPIWMINIISGRPIVDADPTKFNLAIDGELSDNKGTS